MNCRLLLMWMLGSIVSGAIPNSTAEEIRPPFGLAWGESAERLERLLKNHKARVVARRGTDAGMQAWDVEGLVHGGLKRTVFYFRENELREVELQYQREDWDQRKYDEYMGQVRQAIQRKYGEGELIVRKNVPEGDVVQTIVGYKWRQKRAAIELFYYSAQNAQNVFRTISVHYKTL